MKGMVHKKSIIYPPTGCAEKNLGKARTCGFDFFFSSQPYMNTLYFLHVWPKIAEGGRGGR